jgi:hypothetical protein
MAGSLRDTFAALIVVQWNRNSGWHPDTGVRIGVDALFWVLASLPAKVTKSCMHSLEFRPRLRNQVRIRRLELHEVSLEVERGRNGHFNFSHHRKQRDPCRR